jgi:hypothetical protein
MNNDEVTKRLELIFAIADCDEGPLEEGEQEGGFLKIRRLAKEALSLLTCRTCGGSKRGCTDCKPDAGELVKELREESKRLHKLSLTGQCANSFLLDKAADRIEQLELARLNLKSWSYLSKHKDVVVREVYSSCFKYIDRIEQLEETNKEFAEELKGKVAGNVKLHNRNWELERENKEVLHNWQIERYANKRLEAEIEQLKAENKALETWQIKPTEAICLTDLSCKHKKVFRTDEPIPKAEQIEQLKRGTDADRCG